MKYIELRFGNKWNLRMEIEVRGVSGPIQFPLSPDLDLRIIDPVEVFKHTKKDAKNVKVLVGISSL